MFGIRSRGRAALPIALMLCVAVAAAVAVLLVGPGGKATRPRAGSTALPTAGHTAGPATGPTTGPTAGLSVQRWGTPALLTMVMPTCEPTATQVGPPTVTTGTGPLTLETGPQPAGALLPGGEAKSFPVRVTNRSSSPVTFHPGFEITGRGATPVQSRDVGVTLCRVQAPRTGLIYGNEAPQYGQGSGGWWHPADNSDASFVIPPGATYSWRFGVMVPAGRSAVGDGVKVTLTLADAHGMLNSAEVDYGVGAGPAGGAMEEALEGGGTVSSGHPLYLTYTLTNHSGAVVRDGFRPFVSESNDAGSFLTPSFTLAYDVWTDGRWVEAGDWFAYLPAVPPGLADGASVSYRLRVRVVWWNTTEPTDATVLYTQWDSGVWASPPDGIVAHEVTGSGS